MLYYCPLEPYKERYTFQLSAAKTGWLERNWIKHRVPFVRVEGTRTEKEAHIKTGVVLDAVGRSEWCFSQVVKLLHLAQSGELGSNDVIYFDDFWHPGVEALAYAFHQLKINPRMYAFCYAQSVDEYDFTASMQHWMRHYEKGNAKLFSGIFVANTMLKDLLVSGQVVPLSQKDKIHVVGLIFDSEEVRGRMPPFSANREEKVLFTSRWDDEKQPLFFLTVAKKYKEMTEEQVRFVVCTSRPSITSNNVRLLHALSEAEQAGIVEVKEGLSKEAYYAELQSAKVQFNCALQDWVSFTLLEASVAGCFPVYPAYRSFPETFNHNYAFMYKVGDAFAAVSQLRQVLHGAGSKWFWDEASIREREWLYRRYDDTWKRILNVMNPVHTHRAPFDVCPLYINEHNLPVA